MLYCLLCAIGAMEPDNLQRQMLTVTVYGAFGLQDLRGRLDTLHDWQRQLHLVGPTATEPGVVAAAEPGGAGAAIPRGR